MSMFWGISLGSSSQAYTFGDDVLITGAACNYTTSGSPDTRKAILSLQNDNGRYIICTFSSETSQVGLNLKLKKGDSVTFIVNASSAGAFPYPIGVTGYVLNDSGEKQAK